MNEDRHRNILNISGKPEDPLEQDWYALSARLQVLLDRVKPFYRKDVYDEIIKLSKVLTRNKPSKKVYNSVIKRIQEIENVVKDLGGRIR